jgi:hypothetical protein
MENRAFPVKCHPHYPLPHRDRNGRCSIICHISSRDHPTLWRRDSEDARGRAQRAVRSPADPTTTSSCPYPSRSPYCPRWPETPESIQIMLRIPARAQDSA